MDISIKQWEDIPSKLYKPFLKYAHIESLRFSLFCEILKFHKVNVYKLTPDQIFNLFTIVDWTFLEQPPTTALIPHYLSYRQMRYIKMPREKVQDFTCQEFRLLELYYNEVATDTDPKALDNLIYLLTNLGTITNHDQVDKAKKHKYPTWWQRNCIIYAQANLAWFSKLYSIALNPQGAPPTTEPDGLGWTSTFLSVAESGVFGNIDQVHRSNIHDVMAFLIKKTKEVQSIKP
jgi:hypothetical protein